MVSRVTGLARDASFSRVLGAGGVMDAFFFAFMIPNLFRRLFGEGALAAAFLPTFSQLDRDDPAGAGRLASATVALLVSVLGILVLLGEIALFWISARQDHENLALRLMMIMLPYMPLVCVVAILGAMLQVRGRFGPTAAAPIVLNGCLIAATLGIGLLLPADAGEAQRLAHIGVVASAVIVAGVLQVAWSLLALRGGRWWTRDLADAREPLRRVLRRAMPMILGLGVLQLNTFFDGLIASYPTAVGPTIFGAAYPLEEGAMSAVNYAQRLYQFPLGVFGIAIATAIFPTLVRVAGDDAIYASTVARGLRLVAFVGVPASAGLVLVREPFTAVVLQGGDFTAADTTRVSFVLLGYATAIWAYSMIHVLTRALYARHDTVTPVRIALAMVALNVVLNCTLIWTPLREAGLAWSTAICAVGQAALLLRRLGLPKGALATRGVPGAAARTIGATVVMIAVVLGLDALLALVTDDSASWRHAFLDLAVAVTGGIAVFVAMATLLRMPELRWLLGRGQGASGADGDPGTGPSPGPSRL